MHEFNRFISNLGEYSLNSKIGYLIEKWLVKEKFSKIFENAWKTFKIERKTK